MNNQGVMMEIIAYRTRYDIDVRFDDWCGTMLTNIFYANFRRGEVRDPNHRQYFGVGYFGCGPYCERGAQGAYGVWLAMLRRCYSKTCKNYGTYGGRGVYVADEWHSFQVFADWYVHNRIYSDLCIDKDLNGGAYYGPDVCVMIPKALNTALQGGHSNRHSDLPVGVRKHGNQFVAKICRNSKYSYLGLYVTADEAYAAYAAAKADYVESVASGLDQFLSDDARAAVANYCGRFRREADDIMASPRSSAGQ